MSKNMKYLDTYIKDKPTSQPASEENNNVEYDQPGGGSFYLMSPDWENFKEWLMGNVNGSAGKPPAPNEQNNNYEDTHIVNVSNYNVDKNQTSDNLIKYNEANGGQQYTTTNDWKLLRRWLKNEVGALKPPDPGKVEPGDPGVKPGEGEPEVKPGKGGPKGEPPGGPKGEPPGGPKGEPPGGPKGEPP